MKKIISLIIIFSFMFIYIPTNAQIVPERIRIGLKYGSSAVSHISVNSKEGFFIRAHGVAFTSFMETTKTEVKVEATNPFVVIEKSGFTNYSDIVNYIHNTSPKCVPYYVNGGFHAVREQIYNQDEANNVLNEAKTINPSAYIASPNNMRVRLRDGKTGGTVVLFSEEKGEILSLENLEYKTLNLGENNNYRGVLEFKRNENSTLNVISNLTMQEYLYSVVPAEIGATAPLEAQKAQAVCARTYSITNYQRHKNDGFSLCASTHCQMYIGTKWERESSSRAVFETNGEVAVYNGKLISAVYSAHTGGRTANVKDVWGTNYPYLVSVEDIYCTDYKWEVPIDYAKITDSMNSKGHDLGNIYSLKVLERTQCNRVKKLEIVGDKGSKVFENEKARTILSLKSQNYYISDGSINHSILTSSGSSTINLNGATALTGSGQITLGTEVSYLDGNGETKTLTAPPSNLIIGEGYGHGVGLSQCGAMGYAKAGWDYQQILKHYYQGIEIVK